MPGWSFAELVPGLTQEVTSVLTELRDPHLRQQMFGEDFLCALGKYDDPVGLGNMLKGMPYFVRRHLGPSYTTKVDLYGPIHNQHPSSNICQTLTRVGNEVYPSPGGTTTQYCCMDQAHMQVLNVTGKSAKRERGKGYPIPLAKWLHGMMLSTLILGPCGFLAASFAFERVTGSNRLKNLAVTRWAWNLCASFTAHRWSRPYFWNGLMLCLTSPTTPRKTRCKVKRLQLPR
eukprot:scaffold42473_cov18-Tisochrysis_lutea.AAC.5